MCNVFLLQGKEDAFGLTSPGSIAFNPCTALKLEDYLKQHQLWNEKGSENEPHLFFRELLVKMYSELGRSSTAMDLTPERKEVMLAADWQKQFVKKDAKETVVHLSVHSSNSDSSTHSGSDSDTSDSDSASSPAKSASTKVASTKVAPAKSPGPAYKKPTTKPPAKQPPKKSPPAPVPAPAPAQLLPATNQFMDIESIATSESESESESESASESESDEDGTDSKSSSEWTE
jgi:hypothetical protein